MVSLYLPNGNPITEDRKFGYKLRWMERLERWAQALVLRCWRNLWFWLATTM